MNHRTFAGPSFSIQTIRISLPKPTLAIQMAKCLRQDEKIGREMMVSREATKGFPQLTLTDRNLMEFNGGLKQREPSRRQEVSWYGTEESKMSVR